MESRQHGDYLLEELIAEEAGRAIWQGRQISIQRPVVIVELTDHSQREKFLADVRAKAAVDHPLIASIYEAVSDDEHCYVAMEAIPVRSLAYRKEIKEPLRPLELAHILRRVAEAMQQLAGVATLPLTLDSIFYDANGIVRIANLVVSGEVNEAQKNQDVVTLGIDLVPLVADGQAGASRMLTVLAWMRGESLERPLNWEEVEAYGEQIDSQLTEMPSALPEAQTVMIGKRRPAYWKWAAGVAGVVVLVFGWWLMQLQKEEQRVKLEKTKLPDAIEIPAGKYLVMDDKRAQLPGFHIAAHETTIGEYLKFLEMLDRLPADKRGVFDENNQPESKQDHKPDDWEAMLEAAKNQTKWEGVELSMMHPVVNVDWWDAVAYCKWKSTSLPDREARIPTQEEWFAALQYEFQNPESLRGSDWVHVLDIGEADRTPKGLLGMAGSVSEWTLEPAMNPANPIGERQYVIVGGSYMSPNQGALSRLWTTDRSSRHIDVGFRIVTVPRERKPGK